MTLRRKRYPEPITGRAWYGVGFGYGMNGLNMDQFTGSDPQINNDNVPLSENQMGDVTPTAGGGVITE